jgi:superfamily II DNA/RNA helicase
MATTVKNQKEILEKLKIEELNPMQKEAQFSIHSNSEIILLSPTGTGKTLAFLLPIISELDPNCEEVQILILTPSRELAIQIEQVTRDMGMGYKTNAVYGGRTFSKDKVELKHKPAILIGTPGRVADHLRKEIFSVEHIQTIVLDEYDKSLEVGFEEEMKEILEALPNIKKKILTSATEKKDLPSFVELENPTTVNFLNKKQLKLEIKVINSPEKDKLETLVDTLCHIGNQPGIIFCNFKESINRVSDFLNENNISHGIFYGGMEQKDRERALIKFRNGTHQLIIATDLAARGIDINELKFIIHYQLPPKVEEFTHRNGRTARMNSDGISYVIKYKNEPLPEFIRAEELKVEPAPIPQISEWGTLFVSGGRKDKISKGDIAGLFFKQGNLQKDDLGIIELKQDCAFVGVKSSKINQLIQLVDNSKLKKKKVKIKQI